VQVVSNQKEKENHEKMKCDKVICMI